MPGRPPLRMKCTPPKSALCKEYWKLGRSSSITRASACVSGSMRSKNARSSSTGKVHSGWSSRAGR